MKVILLLYIIFQALIAFHLLFPFFLLLAGSLKPKKRRADIVIKEADYAIIVTAYEQTDMLPAVVDSIFQLDYSNYLVYIVADKCDISTLPFDDPRVIILRPEETLASNIKSHFYAIHRFRRNHERLTIIDSDNLVHPQYLKELDKVFNDGYLAVQGVREAKNLNSEYACLDAAGDIYYRFLDRQLLFRAGSSASLAGSGMAFTTSLYRDCLEASGAKGAGFDKILQYEILQRKLKIAFAAKAIVYDEKTAKSDQLVKQRARWINTWFKFFILGIKMHLSAIVSFNWNRFAFSMMLLRPPLFILMGLAFACFLINLFFMPLAAALWLVVFVIFIFIFFRSLSVFKADKRIYTALGSIPKFVFHQVIALGKAKKANSFSVATRHSHQSSINDLHTREK